MRLVCVSHNIKCSFGPSSAAYYYYYYYYYYYSFHFTVTWKLSCSQFNSLPLVFLHVLTGGDLQYVLHLPTYRFSLVTIIIHNFIQSSMHMYLL